LTTLLLDVLKKSAPSRVVSLTSIASFSAGVNFEDWNSEKKYEKWPAYAQSKTANILFVKQLNALMVKENAKVTAIAVHPGGIQTGLSRFLDDNDRQMMIRNRYRFKNISQGASTTITAATSPEFANKGGIYLADCNELQPAAWASDMALAQKLWDLTEKIIVERSKF